MKKYIYSLILLVFVAITFMGLVFLLEIAIDNFIVPSDYLFYEHSPVSFYAFVCLILGFSVFIPFYIFKRLNMIKKLGIRFDPDAYWGLDTLSNLLIKMGKWKIGILILWLIAIYATSTSLTCVTEDKIVAFSPLSPNGQVYSFSDVEKIEAGFGDKLFSLSEYKTKGSFYYKVYIDGDEHVFHAPTVNPDIERYEDTYLELEELDKKLTELGIPKKSSSKGYENCDFDKEFVDRFLRIIELRKTK